MSPSSFAPTLAESAGASEDKLSRFRLPTTAACLPHSALRTIVIPEPLNPLTPSRFLPSRAFSLVELLAVVGIIAMISVAAVPVMRGLGGSQSSRATAQVLVSALEQARTAAILSGTNAFLVLPDGTFPSTNHRFSSYAILRPPSDLENTSGWILLSKWERLPGDLLFSSNRLATLPVLAVSNLPVPGNPSWQGNLRSIGFAPSGELVDSLGTNGLLFASSNKVSNGQASVADRIDISFYSGRVRYTGLVTNTSF